MKNLLIVLSMFLWAVNLHAQSVSHFIEVSSTGIVSAPSFSWTETSFDFGSIEQGKPVMHEFSFVNTGTEPLIISSVKASCGCTVTEFSKDPIAPGGSGFVKATYNAAKPGVFSKNITVQANADVSTVVLTINGEVKESINN